MTIDVTSLIGSSTPGALLNFDPYQHYTWRFIDTALGFSGIPIEDIALIINDAQFAAANGIPTGRFSVIQDTLNSLALSFATLTPGDYDGNDIVDAADYNLWRSTLGSITDRRADGNRNGGVDAGDYVLWRKNQSAAGSGSTTLSNPASVPEPQTAFLLSTIFALAALKRCTLCHIKAKFRLRLNVSH